VANEAKKLAAAAIRGARTTVSKAEKRLKEVLDIKRSQESIEFPDTKFNLPVFYGLTGQRIEKLVDMEKMIKEAESLLGDIPAATLYLPYLGQALDAGIAAIFAQEVIESLNFAIDPQLRDEIWLGTLSDSVVKEHGTRLLEGKAAGFVALVGAAPSNETAKKVAFELTNENFYVFMAGSDNDLSMAQQLKEVGVELGWDTKLIPFDYQIYGHVFTLGFAVRMAMILGRINPGDYQRILDYCKNIFGFFMVLNEFDDEKYATAAGAISFGFLTMAKVYVQQLLPIHTLHRLR
jgi:acetyl-CoA synthase